MKKAAVIILAVAILGALGMYVNQSPANGSASSASRTVSPVSSVGSTTQTTTPSSGSSTTSGASYKDGTYRASSDTPYGTVEIAVVISGGKISDIRYLQMPSDEGHSREVTAYAAPLLKQATLQAQTASIDFVSGATDTSMAYRQSLQAALDQAAL